MSKNSQMANKTKLSPVYKKLVLLILLIIISSGILVLGIFSFNKINFQADSGQKQEKNTLPAGAVCLKARGSSINCDANLETASTHQERSEGLSGRQTMADSEGMLFISDHSEIQCMWMLGMMFSLDIIWLDESKTITKLEKNVSPDTYPRDFCSEVPDKYVIELTAGSAERLGLAKGQTLSF